MLAVVEQESTYRADPAVPGLGRIAREEIDRRAERAGVPKLLVQAALQLRSPDSRSYSERIDAARTEKELSDLFEDFIAQVPLGQRFFAGYNPVRTGGPMQVSIEFAEAHIKARSYPYRVAGSIRDEVFTRRGGLYFGIAHLLDYPADYDQAISTASPISTPASTRAATPRSRTRRASRRGRRSSSTATSSSPAATAPSRAAPRRRSARSPPRLDLSDAEIRRALEQEGRADFDQTRLYARVFELAAQAGKRPLPRAVLPRIRLVSPKITRPLTTEWFARRVDERYQRCLAKAG